MPPPISETSVDARRLLRRVYGDEHGYGLSRDDKQRVLRVGSSPTYGELMPTATERLLGELALRRSDVLVDLGSGIGKLVLHAALVTPARAALGFELVRSRHTIALQARQKALDVGLRRAQRAHYYCRDFMKADLSEATVIYACSTAFPCSLLDRLTERVARLPEGTRFVTLQEPDDNPWFEHQRTLALDTSWKRRCHVHIYRLVRRR